MTDNPAEKWWIEHPWRMVQTNLREIDMEDMDAEKFADELADFHATVVNFNAAGMLANYDTKLPYQKKNTHLKGSSMKDVIDACHRRGIRVVARCDFSKVPESVYKEHPDWAYRTAEGGVLLYNGYVTTCVNSVYQQKNMFDVLRELFTTHDLDGLFLNMTTLNIVDYDGNYYGPCHCRNCQELFRKEYGMEIPEKRDFNDPAYLKYYEVMMGCPAAQRKRIHEMLQEIRPTIAFNFFEFKRTECNQAIGRAPWVYDSSMNGRRSRGEDWKTVPDNSSVDFMSFRYRHSSISSPLLELRAWQSLANTGSLSFYIMGTLGKHKDRSGVEATRKVFDFMAAHDDLFSGLTSAAKVLMIDSPEIGRENAECAGLSEVLMQAHIPFKQGEPKDIRPEVLSAYEAVVLSDVRRLSDEQGAVLDRFVENGGKLVATGRTGCFNEQDEERENCVLKAFGTGTIREVREGLRTSVFELSPEDAGLLAESSEKMLGYIVPGEELVVFETDGKVKTCMTLVPEQPAGPPEICYAVGKTEIPGLYLNTYGKGTAVFVPFMAGSFYRKIGYENTFLFLKDVFLHAAGIQPIAEGLTPMCEVTVMKKSGLEMIQLVNTSGCLGNHFFSPVPLHDIQLNADAKRKKVYTLNGGKCNVKEDNGKCMLVLDRLGNYEAIVIED